MAKQRIVPFRYDADRWHIVQLIAKRLTVLKDGKLQGCTGSEIIRELLDEWLSEQSNEWYPKLLADFKKHNVHNSTRELIEEGIRLYAESARINKNESELADLKKRMLEVGFTETEYEAITGGK